MTWRNFVLWSLGGIMIAFCLLFINLLATYSKANVEYVEWDTINLIVSGMVISTLLFVAWDQYLTAYNNRGKGV